MRRLIALLILVALLGLVARCTAERLAMICPEWNLAFDGYGSAHCEGGAVVLEPMASTQASETHAALALATTAGAEDGALTLVDAEMTTLAQLRTGSPPNVWEVAWLLWNYQDSEHFYALVLKSNGWEVSKQDPQYPGAQRFLASGTSPVFALGAPHSVRLLIDTREEGRMQADIEVDGVRLATVVDEESPYSSGPVAAYTEDARVRLLITRH